MRDSKAIYLDHYTKEVTNPETKEKKTKLMLSFAAKDVNSGDHINGYTGQILEANDFKLLKDCEFGDELDMIYNEKRYKNGGSVLQVEAILSINKEV